MKAIGIVAEFNPFHNGHAHIIKQAKLNTNADYAVIVMSGDFVQRGEPACIDKYVRTTMALSGGADVVLELPMLFATASAEYFATAAVSILAGTGVVSEICFGTKHPDFPYEAVAKLIKEEPVLYKDALKENLSKGLSFPDARANAICVALPSDVQSPDFADLLSEPNTILGIEYAKAAFEYNLSIHPIQREGNGYHSTELDGEYVSATAIRKTIISSAPIPGVSEENSNRIKEYRTSKEILSANSLSDLLYQSLLLNENTGYETFFDCDADLSNRIRNSIAKFESFEQFIEILKTKRYTYARISRVLLHIALGITNKDIAADYQEHLYLRLLGFRKDSTDVLSAIKKNASLPLIAKMADAKEVLSNEAYQILSKDIYAANLYEQLAYLKDAKRNEIVQSPIKI